MNLRTKFLLALTILLLSGSLLAQESSHVYDPDLLARLSYDTSAILQADNIRHMCIAIFHNGGYRIVESDGSIPTRWLQGKMSREQFEQLKKLLDSSEFKALSGNHGGLIRQVSESFSAEIPDILAPSNQDKTQRLHWLNPDGKRPFPDSVMQIVNWLKTFEPANAKTFEFENGGYPDVCPSRGFQLLQSSLRP